MLAAHFIDVMRCPVTKQALIYFPRGEADRDEADAFLLSVSARLRYRIENRVPVLLADEATSVEPRECDRLVARARALGLDVAP